MRKKIPLNQKTWCGESHLQAEDKKLRNSALDCPQEKEDSEKEGLIRKYFSENFLHTRYVS